MKQSIVNGSLGWGSDPTGLLIAGIQLKMDYFRSFLHRRHVCPSGQNLICHSGWKHESCSEKSKHFIVSFPV